MNTHILQSGLPVLLLDVDGLIADFVTLYVNIASTALGRPFANFACTEWDVGDALKLSKQEKDQVHALLNAPGIAMLANPYPGSVEAVKELANISDIHFVTSSIGSPTWAYDRQEWLEKHFGEELGEKVISTKHKERVSGDIFVDDKPENVRRWSIENPQNQALLWDQLYNREAVHLRRVFNWPELVGIVRLCQPIVAAKP